MSRAILDRPPAAAESQEAARPVSGRGGPLRAAARIARREALRAKGRTGLIAGTVALPVAIVTLWLVAYHMTTIDHPEDYLPTGVEAKLMWVGGPTMQDGPLGYNTVTDDSSGADLPASQVLARLTQVLPGASTLMLGNCDELTAESAGQSGDMRTCSVVSGDRELIELSAGRLPETSSEIVVPQWFVAGGSGLAETIRLSNAGTGGDPAERDVHVVGVLTDSGWEVNAILGGEGGSPTAAFTEGTIYVAGVSVDWDRVVELNAAGFYGPARTAITHPPKEKDTPYVQAGHVTYGSGPDSSFLMLLALGGAGIVLILVLIVAPAHVIGVRRSARTYALLAATGADSRTLRRVVLLGAAVQGLFAAILGIGLGVVAVMVIDRFAPHALSGRDVPLRLPVLQLGGVAALAALVVVIAALLPARAAGRTDVVRVLAGRRCEPPPSARMPLIGLALLVAGVAAGAWAARAHSPVVIVVALLAVIAGIILSIGTILASLARLASGTSLATRFAVRDAARNRSRTVAAVTAVLAATTALVAGIAIAASEQAHDQRITVHGAGHGSITAIRYATPDESLREIGVADGLAQALRSVHEVDSGARGKIINAASWDPSALTQEQLGALAQGGYGSPLDALADVDKLCPTWNLDLPNEELQQIQRNDARCWESRGQIGGGWNVSEFVDDGTALRASGLPQADDVANALSQGLVAVGDERLLHPDGTAHLIVREVQTLEEEVESENEPDAEPAPVVVAAAYFPSLQNTNFRIIVPPRVAQDLGVIAVPVGLVITPSDPETAAEVAGALGSSLGKSAYVEVEDWMQNPYRALIRILVASGLVLGAGTAGLVLFLVGAESRADLAVLSAVGASPRTRRRFAAAQAGVVVGIGTVLGALAGIGVAGALVTINANLHGGIDPTWTLAVPWVEVGLILLVLPSAAWFTGWLGSRSRLPLPSEVR